MTRSPITSKARFHAVSAARCSALAVLACVAIVSPAKSAALSARCLDAASTRFGHSNPRVLRALFAQESSGRCRARHPTNLNGSYDIGCMGINSAWLPTLQAKFGITEKDLLEPCTNVHVGAWIYAKNVRKYGDSWRAIGAYNAKSEHKRMAYAWKINKHLDAMH